MDCRVTVSVVIPIRNEEKYISHCLETVLANEVPAGLSFEVLVIDGLSTDRSAEIVCQIAAEDPRVQLLLNPKRIAPSAMNIGIRAARGRYIIRLDAHAEYPPDYIRNCVEELERTGADNVGGRLVVRPGASTTMAAAIALAQQHRFGVGGVAYRLGRGDRYVDTVPFGAFRREVFDKVGYFNEEMVRHQDFELNTRIRRAGGRIFLSSKIYCVYYARPTLRSFLQQMYKNGQWNAKAWLWHPATFCPRRVAPLVFVMVLLFSALAGLFYPPAAILGVLAMLAHTICASVATRQLSRIDQSGGILVAPLFLLMHLSFGIGLLGGLPAAVLAHKSAVLVPIGSERQS